MEFYAVPIEDSSSVPEKFILFRPLLGIAFLGNRAAVTLTHAILENKVQEHQIAACRKLYPFLSSIGFVRNDPIHPRLPDKSQFTPTHAVLLMTNQCQLRCIYCYASGGEFIPETLSVESGKAAIDEVANNAAKQEKERFSLSFHGGGEPMLAWRAIKALVHYARQKELPCHLNLTSNGVWSEEQTAWVIENIDSITISMDGQPAVQDVNRPMADGSPTSERVYRILHALDAEGKKYAVRMTIIEPWENFPTGVKYVLENTKCKTIQVEPAFTSTRGHHANPTPVQAKGFCDAFLQAAKIAQENQAVLRYSAARTNRPTSTFCSAPYQSLIINPKNELVACYEITNKDHELAPLSHVGNFTKNNFSIDFDNRHALLNIIEEKRASCRDCFCYWSCAGDCYSRTLTIQNGQPAYQKSRCIINQTLTKELILQKIAEGNGVAYLFPHSPAFRKPD